MFLSLLKLFLFLGYIIYGVFKWTTEKAEIPRKFVILVLGVYLFLDICENFVHSLEIDRMNKHLSREIYKAEQTNFENETELSLKIDTLVGKIYDDYNLKVADEDSKPTK